MGPTPGYYEHELKEFIQAYRSSRLIERLVGSIEDIGSRILSDGESVADRLLGAVVNSIIAGLFSTELKPILKEHIPDLIDMGDYFCVRAVRHVRSYCAYRNLLAALYPDHPSLNTAPQPTQQT